MSVRQFLLVTHRWLGIAGALFLLILGLTGALLVYAESLDHASNPSLFRVARPGEPQPLERVVAVARERKAGAEPRLLVFAKDGAAVEVRFARGAVYVDPSTAAVNGERADPMRTPMRAVRRLHTSLLVGRPGTLVTGLMSLAGFLLTLGGIVLWWPKRIVRVVRTASWRGINHDLHHVVGIVSSLAVAILCGTGALMAAYPLDRPIARPLGARPEVPEPVVDAADTASARAPLDAIVRAADSALVGRTVELALPSRAGQPVVVRKAGANDESEHGRSMVYVNPYTARVMAVDDWRAAGRGSRLLAWRDEAHTGAVYGAWSRVVACIACVLLAFQSVSGPLMWAAPKWRRGRRRSNGAEREIARDAA